MRRLLARLIFAVVLAGSVSAQAQVTSQDTLAFTTASVRLREKPFATARALAALPQGTAVRLYTCAQGWCSVAASRVGGYLLEEFLAAQAPQAAGATAHCRDGTFSFSRTRQGTCSHHGGVAEWLRE
jgi:uncharacterized protein YraI